MTTEKKKRIPKPLPSGATRFLLENCMDFLNLDFEKLSHELALTEDTSHAAGVILPAVAKPLSVILNCKAAAVLNSMKNMKWEEKGKLQHLNTTLSGTLAMIRAASNPHHGSHIVMFSACYREMVEGFEKPVSNVSLNAWIRTAMSGLKFIPSWMGAGHTYIDLMPYDIQDYIKAGSGLNSADLFNTWLNGFRGYMIKNIGESFSSRHGETANGLFFIGSCPKPKCLKIFSKKTQRQIFCSPSCQEALKQDRHRKKKKNT